MQRSPSSLGEFSSPEQIKVHKAHIQEYNAELIHRFQRGEPVAELIRARADFIDKLLIEAWRNLAGECAGALVAVGGYGRQELHLHSDIDILVLLQAPHPETDDDYAWELPFEQAISAFFHFLWNIGLKLGHSARTVDECVAAAREDQTVMTNLMEARLLVGSKALFDTLQIRIGPEHLWPSPQFFAAKMKEQKARYAKFHDTAYKLEPNIKEGPGGLRDIQIIGWIIKRHYHSQDLRRLIVHGWLTEAEYAKLMGAQEFLWRIRFALHALTGRCEDRLLFDHQRDLAYQFGYGEDDTNQAVEQFMQCYFRTVMELERLNEMVLQLFEEIVVHGEEEAIAIPVNADFQSVNNYIEARHAKVFQENPLALLEIFLLLQQNAGLLGIRASTIRLIRQHIYLIDEKFRHTPQACRLFMTILRQAGGITHQLRRMNRYGLLAAYLPDFGKVVGRMQYDLFHVYTVDEHTLFVVRNLRRFALDKYRLDHPHANEIFQLIEKPELLYIAGLMHDIAKGKGGDHSLEGENIARDFCSRHGLGHRETELVQWLVRQHLLMSMTAQRKDISDPEVIHEFATVVGDLNRLNHLYLLTIADIRATNPNLWNTWKEALLRELFCATRHAFRHGLEKPIDLDDRLLVAQRETRERLHHLGLTDEVIDRVWEMVADDYFIRFLPDEIAWHTVAIAACSPEQLPLVVLHPMGQRGSAEIFIHARNQDFIFAHSTAVLDQLGLTIFDAKIITTAHGYVLNSYHVLEQTGEPIKDHRRQIQICSRLRQCLLDPSEEPLRVQRLETRQIKHFAVPTQVFFHEDPQHRHTVLELIATDRPGLLSKVGQAFSRIGIRLYNARISTIGSRAEDIFHITDRNDQALADEGLKRQLKEALIELVGEN
ncbi:MAG: [protein-PII] uridylyltransferase [Methylococcaceae bacterium]|nr:[protein-PII] uridylyltransferase [Methylococcaceae bacterium]